MSIITDFTETVTTTVSEAETKVVAYVREGVERARVQFPAVVDTVNAAQRDLVKVAGDVADRIPAVRRDVAKAMVDAADKLPADARGFVTSVAAKVAPEAPKAARTTGATKASKASKATKATKASKSA
jgi:hypothetical protein